MSPGQLQPQRILVRQVNWLGDAIMTLPALDRLREGFPKAHIAVWTDPKLAGLWPHVPAIDETLTFERHRSMWSNARSIRGKHFDCALILPNSPRSALEMWLAGIPHRIGYGGDGRSFMLNHVVARPSNYQRMRKRSAREVKELVTHPPNPPQAEPAGIHHTQHYLHLVRALGISADALPPRLQVSAASVAEFGTNFLADSQNGAIYGGLNPGAEYGSAKRWPIERYAEAAATLHKQIRCRWIVFGGPGDVDTAGQLERELRSRLSLSPSEPVVTNVAGRTSLSELIAGLKTCAVVLTNDSGPMHVGAAVGTPVIVPFGSTSPMLTGPSYGEEGKHVALRAPVPCAPCFLRTCPIDLRCLTGITVERVVHEALRFFEEKRGT